jgi:hypothetical protein
MLVGRLSCRISFLVSVVIFDVPSDVNRALKFPRKKKEYYIQIPMSNAGKLKGD